MLRRKNDILLKSAFEEAFPDLLRFFFKDADQLFDMQRGFEFMDKELMELFPELEKKGGNRLVDMLVKVYSSEGQEEWLLIHLEIQAQHDRQFSRRMFQYFYRIYDRYDVPITAIAVFTGHQKPVKSDGFHYHFLGTEIHYTYNAYHILEHTEEQLLSMNNPFALIVLAAQKALLMNRIPEHELAKHRLTIARALIASKRYDNERIKRFLYFLKTFIYIGNSEINDTFDYEIDLLTGNTSAMGIIETIQMLTQEEGREKGLEEAKTTFVKNLLQNTDFTFSKIAALADVPLSFVEKIQQEINR
ncbi:hypothetical protein [Siphonobacter sp. SORGH_AS_0500]|uniref:hypothetical protein n=1 Tax=Siphonobacter sp. SORGH_AS_0500 TaxID=1864824 RepID=UPI0028576373|nr:hypothetical protein [Siphonobacter sp. SORGH_AS_0500]MDR6196079.1 hypothetical protein [Siphonobacter sp. SORGH_AS_0500]